MLYQDSSEHSQAKHACPTQSNALHRLSIAFPSSLLQNSFSNGIVLITSIQNVDHHAHIYTGAIANLHLHTHIHTSSSNNMSQSVVQLDVLTGMSDWETKQQCMREE